MADQQYRFLFHLHTFKSYDATTTYEQLYKSIQKHNITHLAITEHNNIDSYQEFKDYLKKKNSNILLIPAIEYTTKIGDIIAMGVDEMIEFSDYKDLLKKIKNKGGIIILPHPFKRKTYPDVLYKYLDFYEIINMRGIGKSFNIMPFKNIKQLYGSDAHNFIELPGIINTFSSDKEFIEALREEMISPEIVTSTLKYHRFVNRVISKIKRKFFKR